MTSGAKEGHVTIGGMAGDRCLPHDGTAKASGSTVRHCPRAARLQQLFGVREVINNPQPAISSVEELGNLCGLLIHHFRALHLHSA
jgi:hypothetical protein